MSVQPYSRTQVVQPPAREFWCRDLVSSRDLSPSEVATVLNLTSLVKARPADFRHALAGKQMAMFFEKPSLRTRLTFEAGMASLGGSVSFVDQTHERLGARETLSDVAHNVERWFQVIVLRTFAHATIEGMAEYSSVPVINALSDLEHPCQALADYFTLQERFGNLKKVCLAFVGDGNNVAHSLLLTCATLGSQIRIATPKGYEPECADCGRRARHCQADGGEDRIDARSPSGRGRRRRGLHRRLGQHGAGARSGRAGQDFRIVPGE